MANPSNNDNHAFSSHQNQLQPFNRATSPNPASTIGGCFNRDPLTGYKCGCRAFWRLHASSTDNCACGHHACFHAGPPSRGIASNDANPISTATQAPDSTLELVQQLQNVSQLLSRIVPATTPSQLPIAGRLHTLPPSSQFGSTEQPSRLETVETVNATQGLGVNFPNDSTPNPLTTSSFARMLQEFMPHAGDSNLPSTYPNSPSMNQHQTTIIPSIEIRQQPAVTPTFQSLTDLATQSVVEENTPEWNNIVPAIVQRAAPRSQPELIRTPSNASTVDQTVDQTVLNSLQSPPLLSLSGDHDPQALTSYLNNLRVLVSQHTNYLRGIFERLDSVENVPSVSSEPPRDVVIYDKFDDVELRVNEMEAKVETHERVIAEVDLDEHFSSKVTRTHHDGSQSPLSLKGRIEELESRMTEIENHLPPSTARPVTIEVVLIPWSRHLKGLWVSNENTKASFDKSALISEEPDDWPVSQNEASSKIGQSLGAADTQNAWSDEAILDWANSTNEWLVPKACGTKSIVYHRLLSRGFVKEVTITNPGAQAIEQAIMEEFSDCLDQIYYPLTPVEKRSRRNIQSRDVFGLESSFIPLRKKRGDSVLHFLAKSEMISPSIWTWEFLMSNVIMRTANGPRRLFITQKDGYLQPNDKNCYHWTWDDLRSWDVKTQEYDRECWNKHPIIDAICTSLQASFESQHSITPPQSPAPVQILKKRADAPETTPEPSELSSLSDDGISENELRQLGQITPITNPVESRLPTGLRSLLNQHLRELGIDNASQFSDRSAERLLDIPSFPRSSFAGRRSTQQNRISPALTEQTRLLEDDQAGSPPLQPDARQRYSLRPIGRSVSNPTQGPRRKRSFSRRSASTNTAAPAQSKRVRASFEPSTNPAFINQLPDHIPPSSPVGSRTRSNKRRRLSEKGSRVESVGLNPYLTPYSANYDDIDTDLEDEPNHDHESEWEGLGGDEAGAEDLGIV